ncbi:MAG: TIGR00730 family Rossman fold protein [Bacteroidales bacterium]|nr:TIGR00730 family Rossman fold protein [Bacteroidales bacterium]
MVKICVFCGSSMGFDAKYREAAKEVADYFVANNISLVYGGASVGLMKILADTLLEKHKEVIGVMPQLLIDKEVAHHHISQMIVVESMAERKQKMIELSDGFIALPGGFGTLDELSEVMTMNQLRINDKPLGILNVDGYFDKLLEFFDHSVKSGFVRPEYRKNLMVSDNIAKLVTEMKNYEPLSIKKWVEDIKVESRH